MISNLPCAGSTQVTPCSQTFSHKWSLCPCAHAGVCGCMLCLVDGAVLCMSEMHATQIKPGVALTRQLINCHRQEELPHGRQQPSQQHVTAQQTGIHNQTTSMLPPAHAHAAGETARRRDPRTHAYRAVPCPHIKMVSSQRWISLLSFVLSSPCSQRTSIGCCIVMCFQKKVCPMGDSCPWSHSVFEHWLHPSRCVTFAIACCPVLYAGVRCTLRSLLTNPALHMACSC